MAERTKNVPQRRSKSTAVQSAARGAPLARRRKDLQPELLIAQAIERGVPVETMERLLAMRDKIIADKARDEYFEALARLQAEMQPIIKNRIIPNKRDSWAEFGKVRSRYASIDHIVEETKTLLRKHGFSYTFKDEREKVSDDVALLKVTCVSHHIGGHEEHATFPVPISSASESFGTSAAQRFAGAFTFGRRQTFCAVYGIMTADPDDDGQGLGDPEGDGQPQAIGDDAAGSSKKGGGKKGAAAESIQKIHEEVEELIKQKASGKAAARFVQIADEHLQSGRADLLDALRTSLKKMKQGR